MKTKFTLSIAALFACGALMLLGERAAAEDAPGKLAPRRALALVRTFNTAQAEAKSRKGHYGSVKDLVAVGYLDPEQFADAEEFGAKVKDYKLSLVVSADGQRYQVSLRPGAGCGYALFSSEAAVIYEGDGLGCAKASD
jgi:hypothetical protein